MIVALAVASGVGLVIWSSLTISPSYLLIDTIQRREHPIAARLATFVLQRVRHVNPNEDDLLRQQLNGCSMLNEAHEDA